MPKRVDVDMVVDSRQDVDLPVRCWFQLESTALRGLCTRF